MTRLDKDIAPLEAAVFQAVRVYDRTGQCPVQDLSRNLPPPLRDAMDQCDVPRLVEAGVHPCLLIMFAYAMGVQRPAFIDRLPPVMLSKETPRWRRS